MSTVKQRCADCRHIFSSMAEPHGQRVDVLRCRCMPPQVAAFVFGGVFPIVNADDHCGQFKAKSE